MQIIKELARWRELVDTPRVVDLRRRVRDAIRALDNEKKWTVQWRVRNGGYSRKRIKEVQR